MKKALLILLAFSAVTASAQEIILRSSDGREAAFTGILAVSPEGVYATKGYSIQPLLIRWNQLDEDYLKERFPRLNNMAVMAFEGGWPVIFPQGIFHQDHAADRPDAAAMRILYHRIPVQYPSFDLFFSRKDPRINRLWEEEGLLYYKEKTKVVLAVEQMAQSLFPQDGLTYNEYGHRRGGKRSPSLSPAEVFMLISDPNFKSTAMAIQYLQHVRFFDAVKDDAEKVVAVARPPLKTELERLAAAIDSINTPGAVSVDALRTIRRFTQSRLLK